jgi:hypothetical protein
MSRRFALFFKFFALRIVCRTNFFSMRINNIFITYNLSRIELAYVFNFLALTSKAMYRNNYVKVGLPMLYMYFLNLRILTELSILGVIRNRD